MKQVYILRGIPGSGKSTKAQELSMGNATICSADDYFIVDGEYRFDRDKLHDAHTECFNRFKRALKRGDSCVIVDNTNTRKREYRRYQKAAELLGYDVEIVVVDEFDVDKCFRRNTHGVPKETIVAMAQRLQESLCNEA